MAIPFRLASTKSSFMKSTVFSIFNLLYTNTNLHLLTTSIPVYWYFFFGRNLVSIWMSSPGTEALLNSFDLTLFLLCLLTIKFLFFHQLYMVLGEQGGVLPSFNQHWYK